MGKGYFFAFEQTMNRITTTITQKTIMV